MVGGTGTKRGKAHRSAVPGDQLEASGGISEERLVVVGDLTSDGRSRRHVTCGEGAKRRRAGIRDRAISPYLTYRAFGAVELTKEGVFKLTGGAWLVKIEGALGGHLKAAVIELKTSDLENYHPDPSSLLSPELLAQRRDKAAPEKETEERLMII